MVAVVVLVIVVVVCSCSSTALLMELLSHTVRILPVENSKIVAKNYE